MPDPINSNAGILGALGNLRKIDEQISKTQDSLASGLRIRSSAGVTASMEVLYAGSGGGGEITFNTAASSGAGVTEKMRIDESGNVGIGVSAPSYVVHASTADNTIAQFQSTDNRAAILVSDDDTNSYFGSENGSTYISNTGGALTSGQLVIDSSGNLLVGKSSSAFGTAGVEINQNGVAGKVFMTRSGGDPLSLNRLSTDGEIQGFYKDGTQVGSIGVVGSDILYIGTSDGSDAGLNFDGDNSRINPCNGTGAATDGALDLGQSGARFKDLYLSNAAYLDKVIGHDDTNTYISFIGSDVTQFVQGGAEAMRLNASGDLLLGVSSLTDSAYHLQTDTGGSTGAQINTVSMGRSGSGYPIIGYNCAPTSTVGTYNKHYVDYASWIQFISGRIDTYTTTTTASGTTTGTAGPYLSSGGTSWTSSSDRRLKDNIEGISYGLEAVKLLNPVSYVRNDRDTGATELGFIAQEVDEVVSEVVSVKDDGYYGIDYERLIPVLTKAIQDPPDIIENLKSRMEQLEGAN